MHLQLELLREQRWPVAVETFPGRRVLVLAPHMDDETFGCGGTIAKSVACGSTVTVAYLTDGRRGYAEPAHPLSAEDRERLEQTVAAARKDEARRAAQRLGITSSICLDLPDRGLEVTAETVSRLACVLEEIRPDTICLPFLNDSHADHWMTNCLFLEAARRAELSPTLPCWGYEVWTPVIPNRLVDITEVIDAKREAMAAFQSQLSQYDYADAMLGLNRYRALITGNGARFAEAFYAVELDVYRGLFERVVVRPRRSRRTITEIGRSTQRRAVAPARG